MNNKIVTATKWSSFAEIFAKIFMPVSQIVLARLLTPDAFGAVATIVMIVSFAEIFSDAGFQKYIIQHEFVDDRDKEECITVAFWSNMIVSLLIWGVICLFSDSLAKIVGSSGLGLAISIACVSIPLEAFSSIQMAIFKRDLDFKTLFKVRLVGVLTPLLVTIPLAVVLKNYWALILGTIAGNAANAIILTFFSYWKPRFFFSFEKLKAMLSFTIWSMLETLTIWLTGNVDIFIVGIYLSNYYLGLYKVSMTTVAQITSLVTAITTPILFSSLSRLQNDENELKKVFFEFQKIVGLLVLPVSFGIFCFRDLIVEILLGRQWNDAAGFVGLWGLMSGITIVLSHYCSEIYRAKGRPKLSVIIQVSHIIVLIPTVLLSVKFGYTDLFIWRSLIRLELVLANLLIMHYCIKLSVYSLIRNILPSLFISLLMAGLGYLCLMQNNSIVWQIICVFICILFYLISIQMFKTERSLVRPIVNRFIPIKNKSI